jgi:hypothetical protein
MHMFTRLIVVAAIAVPALALTGAADAATIIVDANANSSSGSGVGKATGLMLTTGQLFKATVAADDLWNCGALPRWANADGLVKPLFATGADDSGYAAGTQIGAAFPSWTQHGLTAPYDSLVGEIGGVFMFMGTSFDGPAWNTGELKLYFWDENSFDNTQFVTVDLSSGRGVPEPTVWAMMLAGFGLAGVTLRGRRQGLLAA